MRRLLPIASALLLLSSLLIAHAGAQKQLLSLRPGRTAPVSTRFAPSSSSRKFQTKSASSRSSSSSFKKIEKAKVGIFFGRPWVGDWEVRMVAVGSSAEKAGIKAGDTLLEVDGTPANRLQHKDIQSDYLGPKGSTVNFRFQRGNKTFATTVIRDTDSVLPPEDLAIREAAPGIHVIRFGITTLASRKIYRPKLQQLSELKPRGVIVDLRSTIAGDVEEVVLALSAFLPQGTQVIRCANRKLTDRMTADPPLFPAQTPMIALINGGTIGGAEAMANALATNRRAILVGEKTQGMGYAYKFIGENTLFHFGTIQCTLTDATGEELLHKGIQPDVKVITPCTGKNDCVLEEAIALIKKL